MSGSTLNVVMPSCFPFHVKPHVSDDFPSLFLNSAQSSLHLFKILQKDLLLSRHCTHYFVPNSGCLNISYALMLLIIIFVLKLISI